MITSQKPFNADQLLRSWSDFRRVSRRPSPSSELQTAAGRWLRENALVPDCVLCSPARRTRETLESVLDVVGYVEQRLEQAIYDATPGALIALAEAHCDAERLLVIGHNPGLERLVALLHSGQSGDYRGMPPGGIAVLSMPSDRAIEPGIATLSAFWWP